VIVFLSFMQGWHNFLYYMPHQCIYHQVLPPWVLKFLPQKRPLTALKAISANWFTN